MGFLNKAIVQIVVIGFLAFLQPGLFNALSGLGKAGGENADMGNTANSTLYAFFSVFGYFGGAVYNLLGVHANRILMCVGGAAYGLYTCLIYVSSNVESAGWLAVLAGALLGIGAGWFWTAQGAQMLAYSTTDNRGRYIAIFWIIFNLGGTLGGFLSAGINWNTEEEGSASPASYFTFAGLMFLGAVASLFFLVKPSTVIREDGTQVEIVPPGSAMKEIKGALSVVTNKYMLLLTVYFLGTNWVYTYQFNFVNGSLFNIRTRGLNSSFGWMSQMAAAYLISHLLDSKRLSKRQRAMWGYLSSTALFAIAWVVGIVLQYGFEDSYDKDNEIPNPIDINESSRCALPIISYVLYGFADATLQSYAYWIMGALAGTDLALSANFAGYYKGIQSAGAAVAWGIDLNENILYRHQLWIGFSIWAAGSLLAFLAVKSVENDDDSIDVEHIAKLDESKTSISAEPV